jgi:hypothetical protein
MQNRFSKKLGIFIVALLAISTISAAIPFASATITSRPRIYQDANTGDPIYVEAGTYVNITIEGMTITGAQVWLWLSTYGGSEISQVLGDRVYAGPFYLGDITNSTPRAIPISSANVPAPFNAEGRAYNFVLGNGWINGTVPLLVQGSNVDYWIKIADQSPRDAIVGSEVGVSSNRIRFTTGFGATPLAGAPDTEVTVSGYAIQTGIVYNITQGGLLVDYFVASTTHNASGWLWTGFDVPFNILDLKGLTTPAPTMSSTVNITVTNHNTTAMAASWLFVQTFREVYLPTGTFRAHGGDYTGALTLSTGSNYNVTLNWFPANGLASIYLNSTLVASTIGLNGTGGNGYTTLSIPALVTGDYFFRVIDNHLVEYNFTVHVVMVPYITCTPDTGYVGDTFTVTGVNFLDYVGQYITIYFENQYPSAYVRLWNETISSSGWVTGTLTVPQSWGGARYVEARTSNGTVLIAYDMYTVKGKLNVIPDVVNNTVCQVIQVEGTGFSVGGEGGPEDYFFYIDNSMYFGDDEDWGWGVNASGYILTEFAAAGFRPGLHVVHVIADYEGSMPWTIYAKDNFWVSTLGDPIVEYLDAINATVVAINGTTVTLMTTVGELNLTIAELDATITALDGTIATLSTTVGDIQVELTAIGATITTINGNVATIKTDCGTIKTSLTSLSATISSVSGKMATIETTIGTFETKLESIDTVIGAMYGDVVDLATAIGGFETTLDAIDASVTLLGDDIASIDTVLGSVAGTVTGMEGTLATIETDLGTVKVDLASAKTDLSSVKTDVDESLPVTVDMMPVWIAVVLALIAAIGSIAGVFIIQRKIA